MSNKWNIYKNKLICSFGIAFSRRPPMELIPDDILKQLNAVSNRRRFQSQWSPLRQEPEAPLNIATSRLHPALTTAIAGVQGGTAYSRRLVLHGREEALSTPGGSRGMPRRGIAR